MSSSSGNPWSDGGNSFNPTLQELLLSAPEFEGVSSDDNLHMSTLAWQTCTELRDVSRRNDILHRLRAADSQTLTRRNAALQMKLEKISSEVREVLHPTVINDIETCLTHMSEKLNCLSSSNALENIAQAYDHKKRYHSIHVDSLNQDKLSQLISFSHDFDHFERKFGHIISQNGGIIDCGDSSMKDVSNEGGSMKCGSDQISKDDRDLLLSSNRALDTCENTVIVTHLLEEQFRKLTIFHREFKSHILR